MMKKRSATEFIPVIILTLLTVFNIWFIMHQYWLVDSDMAQEMLLAKHLNDTGRIISEDWMYTTELRVYNINLFFRIGLYLFPDNWMYARIFGSFCVYLLFLFSVFRLFTACGYKEMWSYAGIFLMLPVSTMYWFLGLFGLCYIFYAANILIIITCILKPSVLKTAIAVSLSFLLGLNGVKLFLLFYAPLTAAIAFIAAFRKRDEHKHTVIYGFLYSCINLIGVIINYALFTNYHYYRYADVTFIGNQWESDLNAGAFIDKFLDFLSLFGYQGGAKLASLAGVSTILCGILLMVIIAYWKKNDSETIRTDEERLIEYLVLSMLLIDSIAFTLLQANYNSSYWIPAYVLAICIFTMHFKNNKGILMLSAIVFLISGTATLIRNTETPMRGRKGLAEAAGWLTENGYKRGYAQFWDADACTEFSSGSLEIWSLNDINDEKSISWGQLYSHYSDTPDRPFIIVKKGEWIDEAQYPEYSLNFETEEYMIYSMLSTE